MRGTAATASRDAGKLLPGGSLAVVENAGNFTVVNLAGHAALELVARSAGGFELTEESFDFLLLVRRELQFAGDFGERTPSMPSLAMRRRLRRAI